MIQKIIKSLKSIFYYLMFKITKNIRYINMYHSINEGKFIEPITKIQKAYKKFASRKKSAEQICDKELSKILSTHAENVKSHDDLKKSDSFVIYDGKRVIIGEIGSDNWNRGGNPFYISRLFYFLSDIQYPTICSGALVTNHNIPSHNNKLKGVERFVNPNGIVKDLLDNISKGKVFKLNSAFDSSKLYTTLDNNARIIINSKQNLKEFDSRHFFLEILKKATESVESKGI